MSKPTKVTTQDSKDINEMTEEELVAEQEKLAAEEESLREAVEEDYHPEEEKKGEEFQETDSPVHSRRSSVGSRGQDEKDKKIGHSEMVDYQEEVESGDSELRIAIKNAILAGDFDLVQELIENNKDYVDEQNGFGETLLMLIVKNRSDVLTKEMQQKLIQILKDAGADTHVTDESGWTAYSWACYHGEDRDLMKLLEGVYDITPSYSDMFLMSFQYGDEEKSVSLLDKIDINEPHNEDRDTFLLSVVNFVASHNLDLNMIRFLVESGADVNKANIHGVTPLMAAATHGNVDVTNLLISMGANPDLIDKTGHTAADYAGKVGYADVFSALEYSSKVLKRDKESGFAAQAPKRKLKYGYEPGPDVEQEEKKAAEIEARQRDAIEREAREREAREREVREREERIIREGMVREREARARETKERQEQERQEQKRKEKLQEWQGQSLVRAINKKNKVLIGKILGESPELVNYKDKVSGLFAIQLAEKTGDSDIVIMLLENNPKFPVREIDTGSNWGKAPVAEQPEKEKPAKKKPGFWKSLFGKKETSEKGDKKKGASAHTTLQKEDFVESDDEGPEEPSTPAKIHQGDEDKKKKTASTAKKLSPHKASPDHYTIDVDGDEEVAAGLASDSDDNPFLTKPAAAKPSSQVKATGLRKSSSSDGRGGDRGRGTGSDERS